MGLDTGGSAKAGKFVDGSKTRWSGRMSEAVCEAFRGGACRPGVGRLEGPCAILSKWFLPTRLETRTKESKTHASVVVEKPTREMKVIDAKRAQHRPTFVYRRRFE